MCSVCGCGDSHIEEHDHHHDHDHHHHHAPHEPAHRHDHAQPQPASVHHHYYHHGDVHHHVHYHGAGPESAASSAGHHHHHEPEKTPHGDLHYGHGEAQTHVSGVSQRQLLTLEQDILGHNNHIAEHNRAHFTEQHQLVLNLMSSPGSGKTTLLVETLKRLKSYCHCAVIEGDQQTSQDADRIRATNIPAIQVNTGKGCHLDADMIHNAYHQMEMKESGILFIENVGNLVCPASFDLGEHFKVTILSVTEGADKPLKYPNMFAASQLMIINKIDLLPYVNFDLNACIEHARRINPNIQIMRLSATTGEGMDEWLQWLSDRQEILHS
ncbi:hydrogenase nickel incorporation protein HypB [Vibrio quintilis]|uniref:Hydrogenase maturation factor HypB n=1 Tax=Vibrio quintilis TaxID=1117707 RepID=A0A1M7YSJ8_9VIBR|nr:hydrogenase nickel incorporation protein HypB [Vibrio quintilis]SHO55601.1 Hydrogenase isoenzymes nickel incorporation protein HypB [Vibrio quintilis]